VRRRDERAVLSSRLLDTLVVAVRQTLRSSELAIGHGFIAAPGIVDGLERYMLWLQRRAIRSTGCG